ncbi:MAG: hypothetical protein Kow0029_04480 [Candidatus Rifleibacteriota bacterium]
MLFKQKLIFSSTLVSVYMFIFVNVLFALGPTIPQTGIFEGISSHQVIQARIDDKMEQICLPKIEFETDVDDRELKKKLKEGIESQEAIFHLYHNGLGSPKRQGGMLFASDVFLKKIKMTYTGFLRKMGLKFKMSKTPPYEDKAHLRGIAYNQHIVSKMEEAEKSANSKPAKSADGDKKIISNFRVTTIYDVLPKGVIPPSIRRQQKEIEARIKALKGRPYKAEIVTIDPVRWTSGKMGIIAEDGSITNSYLEGQKPDLKITPPQEKNWLTPEMIKELEGQPCEFVLQFDRKGHEVIEQGKYFLRDIYFKDLRLSWEEWLQKHGKTYVDPDARTDFASGTINLEVQLVSGSFTGLKAAVLCGATFQNTNKLVNSKEIFRIFPPNPKPRKFVAFARRFNQLFAGQKADFSILVCPDGKPYTELGQKRVRRIYFPDKQATMQMLQYQLLTGKIK